MINVKILKTFYVNNEVHNNHLNYNQNITLIFYIT